MDPSSHEPPRTTPSPGLCTPHDEERSPKGTQACDPEPRGVEGWEGTSQILSWGRAAVPTGPPPPAEPLTAINGGHGQGILGTQGPQGYDAFQSRKSPGELKAVWIRPPRCLQLFSTETLPVPRPQMCWVRAVGRTEAECPPSGSPHLQTRLLVLETRLGPDAIVPTQIYD